MRKLNYTSILAKTATLSLGLLATGVVYAESNIVSAASVQDKSKNATNEVKVLTNKPISELQKYGLQIDDTDKGTPRRRLMATSGADNQQNNQLQFVSQSHSANRQLKRYQQTYKGIVVEGKQIVVEEVVGANSKSITNSDNQTVSGEILTNISVDTSSAISENKAKVIAQNKFIHDYPDFTMNTDDIDIKPKIINDNKTQRLIYIVTTYAGKPNAAPKQMKYKIDAKTGEIIKEWDDIKYVSYQGVGGNSNVGQYNFDGITMLLNITQQNNNCTMLNNDVKTVHAGNLEDNPYSRYTYNTTAFSYQCDSGFSDAINGGYAPLDDAHYFGSLIVEMYKKWYNVNALSADNGDTMQLVMRAHYGSKYENAFWDSKTMAFGDGAKIFYPLTSLDVAAHEVSHGFTEQHAALEYADQSGALNESFSDMAGMAIKAYLKKEHGDVSAKVYPKTMSGVSWTIGETIKKDGQPLRYMDNPSIDHVSADCVDKKIANNNSCKIDYNDVINNARGNQGYIVHTASGIFNRAFYLIATELGNGDQLDGIKKAFAVMLRANEKYWTSTSDFNNAACGVMKAANELHYPQSAIQNSFIQVGIDTHSCNI